MARILRSSCISNIICVCLLLSCLNETADCLNRTSGHGWRTAEDEAEFVTSEISRRVLPGKPVISYDSMKQNKGYCDATVYGSCIGSPSKFYDNRPCDYNNLCKRDA